MQGEREKILDSCTSDGREKERERERLSGKLECGV